MCWACRNQPKHEKYYLFSRSSFLRYNNIWTSSRHHHVDMTPWNCIYAAVFEGSTFLIFLQFVHLISKIIFFSIFVANQLKFLNATYRLLFFFWNISTFPKLCKFFTFFIFFIASFIFFRTSHFILNFEIFSNFLNILSFLLFLNYL